MCQDGGCAARIFVVSDYRPDEAGRLVAVIPDRCPVAGAGGGCRIWLNHHRVRSSGPQHDLVVVRCVEHRRAFTLYPAGHVPYGRGPVVSASADAKLHAEPWEETIFTAAEDAANEERWPSDSPAEDSRRRRTQGRHLQLGACLTGVDAKLSDEQRALIAKHLDVPTMLLRDAVVAPSCSWPERGKAILAVLAELKHTNSLPERVLAAGAEAQLWPPPWLWVHGGYRSPVPEHRRERLCGCRAPPPTNSRGDR